MEYLQVFQKNSNARPGLIQGKHNLGCRNKIYLTDTQLNTNLDAIKSIFLKKITRSTFFTRN